MDAYEDWLRDIANDYPPDYEVVPTRYGCEVFNEAGEVFNEAGELVDEIDYEPDPFYEQRVRY